MTIASPSLLPRGIRSRPPRRPADPEGDPPTQLSCSSEPNGTRSNTDRPFSHGGRAQRSAEPDHSRCYSRLTAIGYTKYTRLFVESSVNQDPSRKQHSLSASNAIERLDATVYHIYSISRREEHRLRSVGNVG